ncbi:formyltetrahydrofolate deformylase [Propionibacterium sp. oral taxon 192 str. F0372]|uniref:formyltetrahydrofolate deformylase n=1 Tax=Propionibacterium sp. oral taxon 192 TaxID=671222 RepID=UPI0003540CA8|nr:formyltetrahydrofolate deformylase [Propionibacterium sp. oral taxon 192]EPH02384.1 formyltetrahydrofolate deformylase [Propionibacterium sp. oral taxon 192 str. F0372]
MHRLILTFSCTDVPGIVNAVTGVIVAAGGNITELQQFTSLDTGRFFMRIELDVSADRKTFSSLLSQVVSRFDAIWDLVESDRRTRALVLVSKAGGPLNDLLFHKRSGDLPIDIPLVMSNHETLRPMARFYEVGFVSHPVTPETKARFEAEVRRMVELHDIDVVVLARYMQILTPQFCADFPGRIINIHHSFLPGFKGANPYRQAHERGVKLIGATAHFVTKDLDEGPIIEQNVQRVDHSRSVTELTSIGQGLESDTLTSAVRLFAERRIFLDGVRTVIFN